MDPNYHLYDLFISGESYIITLILVFVLITSFAVRHNNFWLLVYLDTLQALSDLAELETILVSDSTGVEKANKTPKQNVKSLPKAEKSSAIADDAPASASSDLPARVSTDGSNEKSSAIADDDLASASSDLPARVSMDGSNESKKAHEFIQVL